MNAIDAAGAPALLPLYLREIRAEVVRAWRTPAYVVPTLLLPVAFYALFGVILAQPGSGMAARTLATFGVGAALGPSLFGFGAGIAADRDTGVLALKHCSPLPLGALLLARLATAMAYTLAVLLMMYALAATAGGVELDGAAWAQLLIVHLGAVMPFCLIGLCVGLRTSSSVAMAVTNLLFLGLAVLGGLWLPLFLFPPWMQHLAQALPSQHLAELALAAARVRAPVATGTHLAVVCGYCAACLAVIATGWRRGLR